jgi:hypothetical protein
LKECSRPELFFIKKIFSKERGTEEECEEGETKGNIWIKRNRRHGRPPYILRFCNQLGFLPPQKIKKKNKSTNT